MKSTIFIAVLLLAQWVHAQSKRVEHKERTENGIIKGWTIVTEYDADGHVVNYDSSYYEKDAADADSGNVRFNFSNPGHTEFQFYHFSDSSGRSFQPYQFGWTDSLFHISPDPDFPDIKEFFENYRQQLYRHYDWPVDSLSPPGIFVFPKDQPVKKI